MGRREKGTVLYSILGMLEEGGVGEDSERHGVGYEKDVDQSLEKESTGQKLMGNNSEIFFGPL